MRAPKNVVLPCLLAVSALTEARAQITSPRSIVTVAVGASGSTPAHGEMYAIDHQTSKATRIKLPQVLEVDRPNCILMTSTINGFLGTDPVNPRATGNIYSFSLFGSTLTLGNSGRPLNRSATAGRNIAQLALVNKRIYFVSQTGGAVGTLQSIPVTGGSVTAEYDLAKLPSTSLTNALTKIGSTVYIGMWILTANAVSGGEIVAFDTVTKQAKKVMDLPLGKYRGTGGSTKISFGIVNMHATANDHLACIGVYGDLAILDPDRANGHRNPRVVSHEFTGVLDSTTGYPVTNTTNSGHFDPASNDWVVGSRDGAIERWCDGHAAFGVVTGIGSHPSPESNSVTGIWHWPNPQSSDRTYGSGCVSYPGGYTPTDASLGAAVAGNRDFRLALYSGTGGEPFILALGIDKQRAFGGTVPLPFDLWPLGAGGCLLRVDPLLIVAGRLGGTGAGRGTTTVPVPLTRAPKGGFFHRQWAVNQPGQTLVVSNARTLTIK